MSEPGSHKSGKSMSLRSDAGSNKGGRKQPAKAALSRRKAKSQFEARSSALDPAVADCGTDESGATEPGKKPALTKETAKADEEAEKEKGELTSKEKLKKMHVARNENIVRFKREFPQFKHLTNQ